MTSFFESGGSNHINSSMESTQHVKDMEDIFKKFDANGDEKISSLELLRFRAWRKKNASVARIFSWLKT